MSSLRHAENKSLWVVRELGDVKHIRQHLLAAMLEGKADVRACRLEQH